MLENVNGMHRRHTGQLPADLANYYAEIDGAVAAESQESRAKRLAVIWTAAAALDPSGSAIEDADLHGLVAQADLRSGA